MKLRPRKGKKIRLMPPIFYMLPDDIIRYIFIRFVVPVAYPLRARLSKPYESGRFPVEAICDRSGVDLWCNTDRLWLESRCARGLVEAHKRVLPRCNGALGHQWSQGV